MKTKQQTLTPRGPLPLIETWDDVRAWVNDGEPRIKKMLYVVEAVNAYASLKQTNAELVALAKRVCFPDGGRDYTDAKEEMAKFLLESAEGSKINDAEGGRA